MASKLRRRLQKALKSSDPNAFIEITNDEGTVQFSIIPSTGEGWIDVLNPEGLKGRAAIKKLRGDFENVLKELPQSRWELNPDDPRKQRIYQDWFKDNPYIKIRTDGEMRADAPGYFLDVPFGGSGDIPSEVKAPFLEAWKNQPLKDDGRTKENIWFYWNPETKQVVEGTKDGGILMKVKASGKFRKDGTPIPQIDISPMGTSRARRQNIAYSTASQWMTDEGKATLREAVRKARLDGGVWHHNIPVEEGPSYYLGRDGLPLSPEERDKRAEMYAEAGIFTGNDPRNIYINPYTGTGPDKALHDYIHNVEYPRMRKGVREAGMWTPRPGPTFFSDLTTIESLHAIRGIGATVNQAKTLFPGLGAYIHATEGYTDFQQRDWPALGMSVAGGVTGEFPATEGVSQAIRAARYQWKQLPPSQQNTVLRGIGERTADLLPETINWNQ